MRHLPILVETNRCFDAQNEVKKECPVCRGTCTCKDCLASQCNDSESKVWHQTSALFCLNSVSSLAYADTSVYAQLFQEYLAGKSRVDKILHFHYLICMLLPVLKRISEDQDSEIETEAKIKGSNFILLSSNIDVFWSSEVAFVDYNKFILDYFVCGREKYFWNSNQAGWIWRQ